ncbi:MAG: hypothetical protein EA383_14220 [Spirochaetaceae bacterium]|nr:MAG: hypothetical protein EA383_14220 [Spirochaetaceae bacterium]
MHTEKTRFRLVGTFIAVLSCLLLPLSAAYATDTHAASLPDLESLLEAGPEAVELTSEEQLLYDLIMEYRREHGLPEIPLSRSLTFVAQVHARDTAYNEFSPPCNLHSWSDNGPWQGGCYTGDHANPGLMLDKPAELTDYSGSGFEISVFAPGGATAVSSLSGWQRSPGHDHVIRNVGTWSRSEWGAIGIGIYKTEAHVWFGSETDPLDSDGEAAGTGAQPRTRNREQEADPFYVSDEDLQYLRSRDIIVYGRPALCGLTDAMMARFDRQNISYRYVDVDADPESNREMWSKIRAADQANEITVNGEAQHQLHLPVVDVGGRISVGNTRAATILAAIREQPVPHDAQNEQLATRSSRMREPENRNPSLGLGVGGGVFSQDVGPDFLANHRLHMTGHLAWRFGDLYRRRSPLQVMVQMTLGAANDLRDEDSSYSPFGQVTAGFVFDDRYRLSGGLDIAAGPVADLAVFDDSTGQYLTRVIQVSSTSYYHGNLTEFYASYHFSVDAELPDVRGGIWSFGISMGLFGR